MEHFPRSFQIFVMFLCLISFVQRLLPAYCLLFFFPHIFQDCILFVTGCRTVCVCALLIPFVDQQVKQNDVGFIKFVCLGLSQPTAFTKSVSDENYLGHLSDRHICSLPNLMIIFWKHMELGVRIFTQRTKLYFITTIYLAMLKHFPGIKNKTT